MSKYKFLVLLCCVVFFACDGDKWTLDKIEVPQKTPVNPCATEFPKPIISVSKQVANVNGFAGNRYIIKMDNASQYPDSLFLKIPNLPACNNDKQMPRTWLYVLGENNEEIFSPCAKKTLSEMKTFNLDYKTQDTKPFSIYIKLVDKKCNKEYRSNSVNIRNL